MLARVELLLLAGHKDPESLVALRKCRRGAESLLTGNEAFLLHSLARAQRGLDGAMAEVGVYQGSSARILCEGKGERPLYLFDTFAGLPEPAAHETSVFTSGQVAADFSRTQAFLGGYSGVHFHAGLFPNSAEPIRHLRFSLVHLDVDLYASTLAGLRFFYPRMVRGGVIIAHDYSVFPGVAKAVNTFLTDKPERLIELPTTQVMFVKL